MYLAETEGFVVSNEAGGMPTRRERREEQSGVASKGVLPADRFDHLPSQDRVGAHRIVATPKRALWYILAALAGIALLTTVGVLVVQSSGSSLDGWILEGEAAPVEPEVVPVLDPEAAVVVLNGTTTPGFGSVVDLAITENAWGTILFSGDAANDQVEISAVFYSVAEDLPAALGLAAELGGVSVYQTNDYNEYGAQLVVLLGADYAGPGKVDLIPPTASIAE